MYNVYAILYYDIPRYMCCALCCALCCAGVSVYFTAEEVSEGTCRHPREENSSEETDTAFTPTQLLEEK